MNQKNSISDKKSYSSIILWNTIKTHMKDSSEWKTVLVVKLIIL